MAFSNEMMIGIVPVKLLYRLFMIGLGFDYYLRQNIDHNFFKIVEKGHGRGEILG